jgi:hypothetical protein
VRRAGIHLTARLLSLDSTEETQKAQDLSENVVINGKRVNEECARGSGPEREYN